MNRRPALVDRAQAVEIYSQPKYRMRPRIPSGMLLPGCGAWKPGSGGSGFCGGAWKPGNGGSGLLGGWWKPNGTGFGAAGFAFPH